MAIIKLKKSKERKDWWRSKSKSVCLAQNILLITDFLTESVHENGYFGYIIKLFHYKISQYPSLFLLQVNQYEAKVVQVQLLVVGSLFINQNQAHEKAKLKEGRM